LTEKTGVSQKTTDILKATDKLYCIILARVDRLEVSDKLYCKNLSMVDMLQVT